MTGKTYDSKCYALAEHFLQDEPCAKDTVQFAQHCHALAIEIQQTIEDWHFGAEVVESAPW